MAFGKVVEGALGVLHVGQQHRIKGRRLAYVGDDREAGEFVDIASGRDDYDKFDRGFLGRQGGNLDQLAMDGC